ncbi:MAG: glycosyltransferase family 4 protein [Candidatus Helarchaeota archaeon]
MREYAGRILMLLEDDFYTDTRVKNEAFLLVKNGYRINIICLRSKNKKFKENNIDSTRLIIHHLPNIILFKKNHMNKNKFQSFLAQFKSIIGYIFKYFYFTLSCFFLSLYVFFRHGFDIIHIHNPPNTLFLIGAFYKLFGKKFIFDHHDLAPELFLSRYKVNGGLMFKLLLIEERLCLRFANIVIATNESYKKIEIERGKINPEKIFIVRNGPNLDELLPVPPDNKLIKINKKILVYVGYMGPQDGLDYLLRALFYLKNNLKRNDFYCVIIGDGDVLEDLKKLSSDLRLNQNVRFTGLLTRKELIPYLSTADICLDPNPLNPLNNVSTMIKVMEYMTFSKPIVSFDLKENRFTAQHAAVYVTPNDEMKYAKAIMKLMDDENARYEMGRYGRKRVEEKLAWQIVSQNLIHAYEWLRKSRKMSPQI